MPHSAKLEQIKPEGKVKTEKGPEGASSQQQRERDAAMQVALLSSSQKQVKRERSLDPDHGVRLEIESAASLCKSMQPQDPDPGRYRFQNQELIN